MKHESVHINDALVSALSLLLSWRLNQPKEKEEGGNNMATKTVVPCKECHEHPCTCFEGEDPVHGKDLHKDGTKADSGKVDLTFLKYFSDALAEVCKVCEVGAKKYTRGGWRYVDNGIQRYDAAMLRHFFCDSDVDRDTGCLHRAQVAWNALASLQLWLEEYKSVIPSRSKTWDEGGH